MSLVEAINDRVAAVELTRFGGGIHTSFGDVGSIGKTDVLRGRVQILSNTKGTYWIPARFVADLDTPIASPKDS